MMAATGFFQLAQPKKELNHGKTTIPDDHQLPLGSQRRA